MINTNEKMKEREIFEVIQYCMLFAFGSSGLYIVHF